MLRDKRQGIGRKLTATSYKLQAGFTLVELIIYIGIVSIVLTSLSYLILDIIGGQVSSQADREVNYNVRHLSTQLATDIRAAESITSITADSLTLSLPGDDISYQFDGNGLLTRQVAAGDPAVVHTSAVTTNGSFTDQSYGSRSQHVGISFTVEYKNPSNRVDYSASSTATFSVELRGKK